MKQKLAIIGASYLQMPLVQKANELGLETHCFAWDEGAVCKPFVDKFYPVSTVEKEKILDLCKKIGIDGIISIASDIAVTTVNYVASNLNLIGNSYTDSGASTNKYKMRERFQKESVSSPRFLKPDKIFNINNINLSLPLIVKPVDRSGSRGVQKVTSYRMLSGAIERASKESFENECIVEEYIEGKEVSVESISWKGKHYILAITDKVTTGAPYFVEIEHHQPSQLNHSILEKIKNETEKALTALNLQNGASHSELKVTHDGNVFVIEIGARMGGDFIGSHLVQLSTGYDFLKGVINVALGQFEVPDLLFQKCSGVYFLSNETKYLLQIIKEADKNKEIIFTEITDIELHTIQCSADRSGYLIYQAEKRLVL